MCFKCFLNVLYIVHVLWSSVLINKFDTKFIVKQYQYCVFGNKKIVHAGHLIQSI